MEHISVLFTEHLQVKTSFPTFRVRMCGFQQMCLTRGWRHGEILASDLFFPEISTFPANQMNLIVRTWERPVQGTVRRDLREEGGPQLGKLDLLRFN